MNIIFIEEMVISFIIPKHTGSSNHFYSGDRQRQQQIKPERYAAHHSKPDRKGKKPDDYLQNRVSIVDQRIFPCIHPHQNHRVVLIPAGIENAGVHICADHCQEKQDM